MSHADDVLQIRQEARVLATVPGKGSGVVLEDLLTRLRTVDPQTAELIGNLLIATRHVSRESRELLGANVARSSAAASNDIDRRTEVDLLVVAPKSIEVAAVLAAFGMDRSDVIRTTRLRSIGYRGTVRGKSVIVCSPLTDGNVTMALFVADWLSDWRPKLAALVGMAGGRPGSVEPGDVVLGDGIYDYQLVRRYVTLDGEVDEEKRFRPYTVKPALLANLRGLGTAAWRKAVVAECRTALRSVDETDKVLPRTALSTWKPELRSGVVLAGSVLIEDNSINQVAEQIHGRANAVEMEGVGFAAVMEEREVAWLTMRGIADMGGHPDYVGEDGKTRTKQWQFAATFAAAHLLRESLAVVNVLN